MSPSGRSENFAAVVMDKFSKLLLLDSNEQSMDNIERVGGVGIAIEEACKRPTYYEVFVESCSGVRRYLTKEHQPLGEWWKNHILQQIDEKEANVAIVEDKLNWSEATRCYSSNHMGIV
jgi:hypothetical protein